MTESQAFLNGQFVPASQAVVSVGDGGFVQGTTIAEQLRTFGGRIFRLREHLERLFRSLSIVGINPGFQPEEMANIASELVSRNHRLLAAGDDLGLAIFVTPGEYRATALGQPSQPLVGMHTTPLRFDQFADKFRLGESLATTDVLQVPAGCWPRELKCRSRMHYYLADRQAHARYPGSRALMTDEDGFITETTTTNVVLYRQTTGLWLPPHEKVLPGISLAVLLELADRLNVPQHERDLMPVDVAECDEAFLTTTAPCLLPVVRFNGQPIGSGAPGPMFRQLLSAWSELVGLDIAAQAAKFATR